MQRTKAVGLLLKQRGSKLRKRLAREAWLARRFDKGAIKHRVFRLDRDIEESPIGMDVKNEVLARAKIGKVSVLEKGVGRGRMLAELKRLAPEKITTTGITLSDTIAKENKPFVDREIRKIGLKLAGKEKFDIIYDSFGEDFNLFNRPLLKHSILNSVSMLKKGGVLFTVFPFFFKESRNGMNLAEGRQFLEQLGRKNGLAVAWHESKPRQLPSLDGTNNWKICDVTLIVAKG